MRHLIDILDLSTEELQELIDTAVDIIENPAKYAHACEGRKLATLFFEPSTRTRLSFEAAMYELGGHVLSVPAAASSSAAKGESVSDTCQVVSCYADVIAMRHPLDGAPLVASFRSGVPIINAGDGGHNHPTQTLADLLTIYREKGRFDNLTVGFCGDLKYGRTVHSLIAALARYTGLKLVLISPEELRVPGYVRYNTLEPHNIPFEETEDLESVIGKLDILYMTRIQKERFEDEATYERLKESYIISLHCPLTPETKALINSERLNKMKPTAILINTSRGPVVDEAAVAEALNQEPRNKVPLRSSSSKVPLYEAARLWIRRLPEPARSPLMSYPHNNKGV